MADNNLTTKEEFLLNPVEEHNITDAAIASFETNLKHPLKATVPITPQQDLHGMPNPYPAGASVNLIPDGTDTSNGYVNGYYLKDDGTVAANTNYYISEYFEIDENTTYTWSNRVNTSVANSICFYDENKDFISGIAIDGQYSHTFTPPEGAVYCRSSQSAYAYQESYPNGAAYQLEIGSAATSYQRYSNICPIEGFASYLINKSQYQAFDTSQFVYTSRQKLQPDGTISDNKYWQATKSFYKCEYLAGKRIITNITGTVVSSNHPTMAFYSDENDSSFIQAFHISNLSLGYMTLTVPATAKYMRVCVPSGGNLSVYYINFGSTLHSKINDLQVFPITFTDPSTGDPMTIYGGSLTLNEDGSADLVSLFETIKIIDFSSLTYNKKIGSYYQYMLTRIPNTAKFNSISGLLWRSDSFVYGDTELNGFSVWRSSTTQTINLNLYFTLDKEILADAKAYLTSIAPVFCSTVRNPSTYHFPNIGQLKAFLGENNVWSDIGNVNVKYLTQHSETGLEYRGDRALELRRRAMMADAPTIHTTVGSEETGGLASFKSYVKAPVKKIEIPFSPKQDLHGMDYPYPAGASVNLIPDGTDTSNGYVNGYYLKDDGTVAANTNYYISEYIELDTEITYTWSNRVNTNINPAICFYDENKEFLSGIAINSQYSQTFTPPEGAVYCRSSQSAYAYQESYPNGAAYQLEIGSAATSYQRYSNICPIEGFSKCDVHGTGKNLMECISANKIGSGVTVSNGVLTAATHNETEAGLIFPVKPNTRYVMSFTKRSGGNAYVRCAEYSKKPTTYSSYRIREIIHSNSAVSTGTVKQSITTGNNAKYVFFGFYRAYNSAAMSTDTWYANLYDDGYVYEEYRGTSIPITFTDPSTGDPITIYGGTVTINPDGSADVVSDRATFKIGDCNTYNQPTIGNSYEAQVFRSAVRSIGNSSFNTLTGAIADQLTEIRGYFYNKYPDRVEAEFGKPCFAFQTANAGAYNEYFTVYIPDTQYTTAADFKEAIKDVEICIVLPEAQKTSYHFSNLEQLKVWLGENNFWCDISDDITVKYWNRG